ncbi:MAG: hypothetical protein PVI65_09430, partial [Desulfobacterales bacterium]
RVLRSLAQQEIGVFSWFQDTRWIMQQLAVARTRCRENKCKTLSHRWVDFQSAPRQRGQLPPGN